MSRSGMLGLEKDCPPWKDTQQELVRTCAKRFELILQKCLTSQPYCVVGALAWNADQLSSGSRDRMILQRDVRTPPLQSERRLQGHRQEVCGLKWSTDHQLLASGGNDNTVRFLLLLDLNAKTLYTLIINMISCFLVTGMESLFT